MSDIAFELLKNEIIVGDNCGKDIEKSKMIKKANVTESEKYENLNDYLKGVNIDQINKILIKINMGLESYSDLKDIFEKHPNKVNKQEGEVKHLNEEVNDLKEDMKKLNKQK